MHRLRRLGAGPVGLAGQGLMAEIVCSLDEPLRPDHLVRRIRLPDGSEAEVPMSEAERQRRFDALCRPATPRREEE
jgi:hypothetical protein